MIEVHYRMMDYWTYPQLLINGVSEWVIDPSRIAFDVSALCAAGLNQSTLAAGYDESIRNVIISRKGR